MRYLFALALLPAAVHAGEYACDYAGSQREMNRCAVDEYKEAFVDYTDAYQKQMEVANHKQQQQLVARANEWARISRMQCLRASKDTGADETILFYSCLRIVTEHRTLELRARQSQR